MDTQTKPPKLMDRVKATMRVKRYSPRTEKTYCYWIRYFIRFHDVRHPASMGASEVRVFLEHLAVERHVAAATQNQALNAIVYLYRQVLAQPSGIGKIVDFGHATARGCWSSAASLAVAGRLRHGRVFSTDSTPQTALLSES